MEGKIYPFFLRALVRGMWNFFDGSYPFKISLMKEDFSFNEEHEFWEEVKSFEVVGEGYPSGGIPVVFDKVETFSDGSAVLSIKPCKIRKVTLEARKFLLHGFTVSPYMIDGLIFYYERGENISRSGGSIYFTWDMRGGLLFLCGE